MKYIILCLLGGLSIAPFLFTKLSIWLAQGLWAHIGIIAMFSCSLISYPNNRIEKNLPAMLLFLWVAFTTSIIFGSVLLQNRYDTQHFFQYFNLFCAIIFYKLVIEYSDDDLIVWGKQLIKITVWFNLFVATMQFLGVSQFFELLFSKKLHGVAGLDNMVVGMIGNGTHLSGFLAMLSPVFFSKKREDILTLVLMGIVLCLAGTTKGEPALNGFIIFGFSALFYSWFKSKKIFWGVIGFCAFIVVFLNFILPEDTKRILLRDNSRLYLWREWWPICKQNFVVGVGLGSINLLTPMTAIKNAYHLHLEYYHFLVELGVIGLILILNVILDFFKTDTNEDTFVFKVILFGFLISCLFTYPAHLFYVAMFALFSYAIVKGNNASIYPQTN